MFARSLSAIVLAATCLAEAASGTYGRAQGGDQFLDVAH